MLVTYAVVFVVVFIKSYFAIANVFLRNSLVKKKYMIKLHAHKFFFHSEKKLLVEPTNYFRTKMTDEFRAMSEEASQNNSPMIHDDVDDVKASSTSTKKISTKTTALKKKKKQKKEKVKKEPRVKRVSNLPKRITVPCTRVLKESNTKWDREGLVIVALVVPGDDTSVPNYQARGNYIGEPERKRNHFISWKDLVPLEGEEEMMAKREEAKKALKMKSKKTSATILNEAAQEILTKTEDAALKWDQTSNSFKTN